MDRLHSSSRHSSIGISGRYVPRRPSASGKWQREAPRRLGCCWHLHLHLHLLHQVDALRRPRSSTHRPSAEGHAESHSPGDSSGHQNEVDVAIVGGGIIGLSIARAFLESGGFSVEVIERSPALCSGATGAGQGYIWMAHREPASPMWELVESSKQQWSRLVGDLQSAPLTGTEWQVNGSMLIASSSEEAAEMEARAARLKEAGVQAEVLSPGQAAAREPSLLIPASGAAMVVAGDAQLNGKSTAKRLLDSCRALGALPGNSFVARFGEAVTGLERDGSGSVTGVSTANGDIVKATRATIVAAGAWTSRCLSEFGDDRWEDLIAPRPGQLLQMEMPQGMAPLRSGVMEMSYAKHYLPKGNGQASVQAAASTSADVTFTATCGASGELLLGSSREFLEGGRDPGRLEVTAAILQRATQFLPGLAEVAETALQEAAEGGGSGQWSGGLVRVGPRPWAAGGLPLVGPVPGAPGLFIAAGHEGSGLTLAPVTADLMLRHVTGAGAEIPKAADALLPSAALGSTGAP